MRVQISMSTELPKSEDGKLINLGAVRRRQVELERMTERLRDLIHLSELQSDYGYAKELESELSTCLAKITVLKRIRTQADRQLYNEYVDVYHET
jgi:hypothetical protein